jgi:NADH-quinone oxidoreductase subunit L
LEGAHHVAFWVKALPTVVAVVGILFAYYLYMTKPRLPAMLATRFRPLYQFSLNKWYFDELYDYIFVRPAKFLGYGLWKQGDGGVIDGIGPDGIAATASAIARRFVKMQSGYVYHYAFLMLAGVAVIITWYLILG